MNQRGEPEGGVCALSVVTPAFNEQENVVRLVEEIEAAVSPLGQAYEIIVVDDSSTDSTPTLLRSLRAGHPCLRVIRMRQRSGQSSALAAGLRYARGRTLATLDADLQNDPADLPAMLARVSSGECDMVNGWRAQRHDTWLRRVSSKVANGVRNRITREQVRDSACGLKVMRRECLADLVWFHGMHRFLPTLVRMQGFRVIEMPVHHRPRVAGKAKYGLFNRLIKPFADTLAVRWMQNRRIRTDCEELGR
ncbi:MAG: glycosyltransferase family 2 protein [Phycisphaerae bacterium]|nr:glycosyltransferase family 2 protein [Phycisphaerae bacterium]